MLNRLLLSRDVPCTYLAYHELKNAIREKCNKGGDTIIIMIVKPDVTYCRSTLFGPTCDGLDTIVREHPLPFLRNGDWIVFPNMGAYSIAGAVNFNGFHVADAPFFYICSEA